MISVSPALGRLLRAACESGVDAALIVDLPNLTRGSGVSESDLSRFVDVMLERNPCLSIVFVFDGRSLRREERGVIRLVKGAAEEYNGRIRVMDVGEFTRANISTDEILVDLFRSELGSGGLVLLATGDYRLVAALEESDGVEVGYHHVALEQRPGGGVSLRATREIARVVQDCKRDPPLSWPEKLRQHVVEVLCAGRIASKKEILLYNYKPPRAKPIDMSVEQHVTNIGSSHELRAFLDRLGIPGDMPVAVVAFTQPLRDTVSRVLASLSPYLNPRPAEPRIVQRLRIPGKHGSILAKPSIRYHIAIPALVLYMQTNPDTGEEWWIARPALYDTALNTYTTIAPQEKGYTREEALERGQLSLTSTIDALDKWETVEEAVEAAQGRPLTIVNPRRTILSKTLAALERKTPPPKPTIVPATAAATEVHLKKQILIIPYAYTLLYTHSPALGPTYLTTLSEPWNPHTRLYLHPLSSLQLRRCSICKKYALDRDMKRKGRQAICPTCYKAIADEKKRGY